MLKPHLTELCQYDASVGQRAEDVRSAYYPNGHSPNGVLGNALSNISPDAHTQFTKEYTWAMAVAVHPYSSHESKEKLMTSATDALYIAGEGYDPSVEPNFLKHFTGFMHRWLPKVLELSALESTISPANFDQIVVDDYMQTMPPLATRRQASSFELGGRVLHLVRDRLVNATIKSARPSTSKIAISERLLSDEEQQLRNEAVYKQAAKQREAGDKYTGAPSRELLRLRLSASPLFGQIVKNPSQGIIHLTSISDPVGLITDMHHNTIIHPNEWNAIKSSRLYRDIWVNEGSVESLRQSGYLDAAIDTRIEEESDSSSDQDGPSASVSNRGAKLRERADQKYVVQVYS